MAIDSSGKQAEIEPGDLVFREIESASLAISAAFDHLQRRWPEAVQLGFTGHAPSIYYSYPYLFLMAFPPLCAARVSELNVAASLFSSSLFVADDLMDEDPTDRDATTNVLRIQAMQLEAYRVLHGLFAPEAGFWDHFQEYLAAYARACLDERRFAAPGTGWEELTETVALGIAKGKCSLAKFVVAGLAELAGDETPLEPLCRALDSYYVARQMMDDLSDWRQDLARGYPSLLLTRVAAGKSKLELARQPEHTGRAIYAGGHARYILDLALRALGDVAELTAPYPDLLLRRVAAKLEARCRALASVFGRLAAAAEALPERGRRRFELALPVSQNPWQELACEALGSLLKRWQPGAGGSTGSPGEPHGYARRWWRAPSGGDVLTRALVADALCDADDFLGGRLRPLLEGEADYLVHYRRPDPGGWGWGSVCPGLPPDADHLGRVLRVLARLGRSGDVEKHCAPPLAILLQVTAQPPGVLPTWILGEAGSAPPAGGPDEAVLAQLLSALLLYSGERFRAVIEDGATWLESRQKADGRWESPGVRGPHLPTAACVELLAVARPRSPALARAAAFLRRSQHGDGGWGILPGRSEAMSTALALLGLARLQPAVGDDEDRERARRGRDCLRVMAHFDAPALPGSRTLTAAFALQTALAWNQVEQAVPAEQAAEVAP